MSKRWPLVFSAGFVFLINPPHAEGWIRAKSLESRLVSYLHRDALSDGNALAEGRLTLEGRREIARGVEAYVSAEVWGDNRSLSSGAIDQIHDRAGRRPSVNAREAYVNVFSDKVDLRIGKQKIPWGKADGLNPTDVFGAFDYADVLNPDRLGIFGLRAFFHLNPSEGQTLECVVLPFYSPSRAGRSNTRWRPVLDGSVPAVPVDVRFPANAVSNADYGLKFSGQWRDWDVSASYARTIDDLAGGERRAAPFVQPLFLKKRTAGFDASRTVSESLWEIHLEAAYTSTPSGYDDDVLQTVIGARRAYTDYYHSVDLDLTLEWAGEHVFSRVRNPLIVQNLFQRPFPGSILADAKFDLSEFVAWTVRGAYTFRGLDAWMVSNEISWRVTDLLDLRAGFDALSGKGTRTTESAYEENDRWRIESTIYFR